MEGMHEARGTKRLVGELLLFFVFFVFFANFSLIYKFQKTIYGGGLCKHVDMRFSSDGNKNNTLLV
jgi:hypothetical protein